MKSPSTPLTDSELAVIRTVAYSAIFDYPLELNQLHLFLIGYRTDREALAALLESSSRLRPVIAFRDGFCFLRGQGANLEVRKRREKRSRELLASNASILKLICAIPYVRLVALSGSAAHRNLTRGGDIDLFIITRRGATWSVAVSILLLTRLLGKRKLFCFNFITSESQLEMQPRDLFTANQIASLQILLNDQMAARYLEQNPFVTHIYPNLERLPGWDLQCRPGSLLQGLKSLLEAIGGLGICRLTESICRGLYRRYLRRQSHSWSTPEDVLLEDERLKLHTHGHRKSVRRRYQQILSQLSDVLEWTVDPPGAAGGEMPAAGRQVTRVSPKTSHAR